tara:strand:- start:308 stop:2356 length:2049 start_codon:yes stop_codon:yes gene_type:complete
MKSASTGLNNLKKSVFNLQTALVGIGGTLVAKSFLDTARETERLQVRFKFLFDDVREGEKAFRGLTEFASKVPFSLEEIQRGAGSLAVVSQSAEEMNRLLAITGDLAVASGLDFQTTSEQLQRVFSSGIASAELFRERGVSQMLGFEAGVSVNAEKSKQHIIDIFEEGSKSFVGGSQVMADTFDGVISMIGDKVRLFKQDVMDAGPFEALKASAQLLDNALVKNFGSIEKSAEAIGEAVVTATMKTILFGASVIDAFRPTFAFIGGSIVNLVNSVRSLPSPIPEIGLLGFLMLGTKGKLAVTGIAMAKKELDELPKTLNPSLALSLRLGEIMAGLAGIEMSTSTKDLNEAMKKTAETAGSTLVPPFEEFNGHLNNSIESGGDLEKKLAEIFKKINEQREATKKLKEEETLRASAVEAVQTALAISHEKTTKAIGDETKAVMTLAQAREGAMKAVQDALSASALPSIDTGLFSNFSKGFKEVADSQKQMFTQMREMGASTFDKLKTSLTDFVMTGKLSFADLGTFVVRSMVDMLIGEAIKNALKGSMAMFKADSIKKAFISLYEGAMKTFASIPFPFNIGAVGGALAFGAGLINKIKGFEKGGRPPVGQPSIVGEKGAELFVPDQAGTIVPNDKLGMGKQVTVNFNINTVDARGFNELLVNSRGVIVNLINSAMNEKGKMAVV